MSYLRVPSFSYRVLPLESRLHSVHDGSYCFADQRPECQIKEQPASKKAARLSSAPERANVLHTINERNWYKLLRFAPSLTSSVKNDARAVDCHGYWKRGTDASLRQNA